MTESKKDTSLDPFVEAIVDMMFQTSTDLVRSGVEVDPQIFLIGRKDDKQAIIPFVGVGRFFESKDAKRNIKPLINKVWKDYSSRNRLVKLMAVIVLSDGYLTELTMEEWEKMGKNASTALGPMLTRPEAILIMVSLSGIDFMYYWPYVHAGAEIVFASEPIRRESKMGESQGLLMGLWPL